MESLVIALFIAVILIGFQFFLQRRSEAQFKAWVDSSAQKEAELSEKVELMSRRAFDDSNQRLSQMNLDQLRLMLDPLRDRIKDFEKRIEDTYSQERIERSQLKSELSRLMDLNHKMSAEASNLTKALKGDVKVQGTWGEMILENILERSGLRKDEEYLVQDTHRTDLGTVVRPDVIVKLPDEKHIIIDSKMSLLSYEEYSRADSTIEQEKWAKAFAESLKNHIHELSARKYHTLESLGSPDFVILFMPLEPAFALAFKLKPELFSDAWEKNIAIVSPTTLLTTLRTVGALWKQDRQEKNALEIAKRGGLLYDKFSLLVKDFETLTEQMSKVQKTIEGIENKLHVGNGNLITQVEKLKELGAKAEKKLPEPKEPGIETALESNPLNS
jgi:DNA recombination protein RmuC